MSTRKLRILGAISEVGYHGIFRVTYQNPEGKLLLKAIDLL
jgi:hypothetical protein